jgi:hypothetical protein
MESHDGLVGNRLERRVRARHCEHAFDAFDHRDGFLPSAVFTGGREGNLGQECKAGKAANTRNIAGLHEGMAARPQWGNTI